MATPAHQFSRPAEMTLELALQTALAHHQAGRFSQAEPLYHQVLAIHSTHPETLHLLGVLTAQTGRPALAVDLLARAVAANPAVPQSRCNFANALREVGKLAEAEREYREAIRLNPHFFDAHNYLGVVLREQGKPGESLAAHARAIQLSPKSPDAYYNLALALSAAKRHSDAAAAYRVALALKPDYSAAIRNLGLELMAVGQLDEAIEVIRHAMKTSNDADLYCNLGNALRKKDLHDDAIAAYRQALQRKPDRPEFHYNLGVAMSELGRFDEAVAAYRAAIHLQPDFASAHWNLSLALLVRGEFREAWAEYEWRWRCDDFPSPRRNFPQPRWDGGPLDGRTILLHCEQGFGDAIQFIRYAPRVRDLGARVILECGPELRRLLSCAPGIDQIVAPGAHPAFDVHCPLLTLPLLFDTQLQSIPAPAPYLRADDQLSQAFAGRLGVSRKTKRVGLAWAGRPTYSQDRKRSIQLCEFSPLASTAGVTFVSLQKGEPARQSADWPTTAWVDVTTELHDFADTAALIANLDLVITVDTAVAHLAGAMGKPVWILLPTMPDWRWMLDREDSPWYSSARLFRQSKRGDWAEVIERIARALREWHATG